MAHPMTKDALEHELKELVLEIRQYLINTEFAPEPFTEPIDPEIFKGKFAKKIRETLEQCLEELKEKNEPNKY